MTIAPVAVARRWPVATYFALAFGLTWSLLPMARTSVAIAILSLFGPAAAAAIVSVLLGGRELHELGDRITRWRVPWYWYLLALIPPLAVSALAGGIERLWGAPGPIRFLPLSWLGLTVFVMVIGEEIGWRGFALPRLLDRFGPWIASTIVGTAWALWHLPLFFLESMPQFGNPFGPFIIYTIALSVILTFFATNTRNSVVIATLFHGSVNTFGFTNEAASSLERGWGNAVAYGIVALALGAAAWGRGSNATGPQRPGDR